MQQRSVLDRPRRRGAILFLNALLMVFTVGMVAFAVDVGYVLLARTKLQAAADAAALAGAGAAIEGSDAAVEEAIDYAVRNSTRGCRIERDQVEVRVGSWDTATRQFTPGLSDCSAVEVTVQSGPLPLFFGGVFGRRGFDTQAHAVATFAPRDIMLALDYSGSMCFDSQLRSIGALGQAAVEANLLQIYQDLGSPRFGTLAWTPVQDNATAAIIKQHFGLTGVAYPYPPDTWDNYINYVKTDNVIAQAGYRNKYGYLTWVNYLQARRSAASQTPDLWQTHEQPVTAVKDSVDLLNAYLQAHCPDDRMGLAVYTAADGTAILENELTHDLARVADIARRRQAGHYLSGTNIAAGMRVARLELERNGRVRARRLMVLITDGEANLPGNGSAPKRAALDEAREAARLRIPIVAIALGSGADTALMGEIAAITSGAFFRIPGGQSVAQYQAQLEEVFRQVASSRPLNLVQ